MKLKVFTLRMDDASGKFDESAVQEFLGDQDQPRDVIEVSDHFFVHDKRPTWALLVTYRDVPQPGAARQEQDPRKDWRAELDGPAKELYDQLRLWRSKTAKHDGLPPYLICTNRQVAEIVVRRPTSLAQLGEIQGIGEAKLARWGSEILAIVQAAAPVSDAKPAEPGAHA